MHIYLKKSPVLPGTIFATSNNMKRTRWKRSKTEQDVHELKHDYKYPSRIKYISDTVNCWVLAND